MIGLILGQVWPCLLGAAAIVAGWFAARAGGKAAARQEMDAQINQQADQARKGTRDVADKVDSMDDAAVRDSARKWVRGDD